MPEIGIAVGSLAHLPNMWTRRLLRQFTEPTRNQAFPCDRPSDHRGLRSARGMGVVLRGRGYVWSVRSSYAAGWTDPSLLL